MGRGGLPAGSGISTGNGGGGISAGGTKSRDEVEPEEEHERVEPLVERLFLPIVQKGNGEIQIRDDE